MDWTVLRDDVSLLLILGVITFYQLVKATKQTLLSILVMGMFAWVGYRYLSGKATQMQEKLKTDAAMLDEQAKWRKETGSNQNFVATFPKKDFRFLKFNDGLVKIAKYVIVSKKFDRARYSDLLLHMDKMQKIYMYILDGRYVSKQFIPVFLDLRENVIEVLYSLYFVVPSKHHEGIAHAIEEFQRLSQQMITILRSYHRKTAKQPHFPELFPQAADGPFEQRKTRVLP